VGSIHLKNHNITFIHIPKNGGSSVRAALRTVPGAEFMPLNGRDINIKHPDIDTTRNHFGDLGWTFCVVRNPYDRIVSMWRQIRRVTNYTGDLNHFILEHADYNTFMKPQSKWFNHGEIDFIIRFENLCNDWETIRKKIKCGKLPHKNRSSRAKWIILEDYSWTKETKKVVQEKFKEDFKRFEYNPNQLGTYSKEEKA
tara:strand:+ start:140 stop:733 length:594 start_codon:yes stop_codon:yes gene_type:complete